MSCSNNQSRECLISTLSTHGVSDYRMMALSITVGVGVLFSVIIIAWIIKELGKDMTIENAIRNSIWSVGFIIVLLFVLPMII
ncbi:hypothetical protein [Photobacterium kishitanii]|uniref:DUF3262 domain-containing protein n=1 Tax=Photobacterium kishitanii TaxID=318456 RepID=A0AAX0YWH0_9GAMM|nr:hypothetical protein [Photobacterium kishitanii]PSX44093.1 hypothetical protein C0W53_15815 [Photobacterium kishitanii]